ncbi:MAG: tRNA lysidine(34) synthetase TilS, partial [Candidatus Eisenbacteria bacterium]|nr:tRNA lysidine(34) synthetase TilS [Candidatus Eisenbacteria bacterium]
MSLARRLEDEVVSFLRATRRAPDPIPEAGPPPCLLVAVSGGGDSTALLKLLHATRLRHGFGLIAAHVHHGVRPDADEEERRVASLCGRLEIPFEVARLDRRGGRPSPGEATLREPRYAALRRIARDRGCRAIVLGHQRDDQIETVLMALMRGTGIEGIAGMRRRRGDLPVSYTHLR